jgi:hypothetical protein
MMSDHGTKAVSESLNMRRWFAALTATLLLIPIKAYWAAVPCRRGLNRGPATLTVLLPRRPTRGLVRSPDAPPRQPRQSRVPTRVRLPTTAC